jgi:HK97 family phage portal protein
MGWNTPNNKGIGNGGQKAIPYGAPVSTNPSLAIDRGYHDGWDIERAYRDGMKRVTWLFRAVDAIAGNQARLPVRARNNNSPVGPIVDDASILKLFNMASNPGENSFIFRHRLSAQMLLSTRGAFVEIISGRDGRPTALHLLPPQHTSPIPDPRKFVSGYEVLMPSGQRTILKPEQVLWFRHPHPLDPYLSMTPMESAGVAIEIENLAKFYNRNFLVNDGRPGGLLVVRGDMDEEDKEELRSRFRGNIGRAGGTTVIASEEGADYVDTGSNPRDAAYVEMRRLTKEEILAAFGVPESVIGNASGRTFSNAAEELRVFWMETMQPHLEMLARGFDPLDPKLWFEFDNSNVPILILAKQEREQYLLQEFNNGLITANEYRAGTGRDPVESDLADSMLANPNLAPIGNTEREMPYVDPATQQQAMGAMPGDPGAPPAEQPLPEGVSEVAPEAPAEAPAPPDAGSAEPPLPEGVTIVDEADMAPAAQENDPTAPSLDGARRPPADAPQLKTLKQAIFDEDFETKADTATERWEQILDRTLERLYERQQRVVMEKARGSKARKAIAEGRLTTEQLFDLPGWNRQTAEDVTPVLAGIMAEASALVGEKTNTEIARDEEFTGLADQQAQRVQQANSTTQEKIAAAVFAAKTLAASDGVDSGHALLLAGLAAVFVELLGGRRNRISQIEGQSAFNGGLYLAGQRSGLLEKTWVTRRDDRVRPAHRSLDGTTVQMGQSFKVNGMPLRFPGDPMAPASLSLACRCRLRYRS